MRRIFQRVTASRERLAVIGIVAALLFSTVARGQSITWSGSSSPLWNVNGNWFGDAQPGSSNTVVFDANSTLNLSGTLGADFSIAGLTAGSTPGNVSIGGANTLTLGTNGIDMSSASNSSNNLTIASTVNFNATSTVNVASERTLTLATANVRTGTLAFNGAGLTNYGSTFTVGSNGGTVQLNISSGTLANTANVAFFVGNSSGVNATVNQSGGTVSASQLFLGQSAASSTYNFSAGSLSLSNNVYIGMNGNRGAFTNTGGSLTQSGGAFWVGYNGPGTYDQSSGSAQVSVFRMNSSGTMTISGGSFTANAWDSLANQANEQAAIILRGGTTTLPAFPTTRGANATATVTFDGGVLRPAGSSSTYMQGLTNAYLTNNGAIFNTNGNNITVAQPLVNGTAAGTAGTLTKVGSGNLTLTGSNTYSGTTTVSAGSLFVGAGGTAGTLGTGPVVNNSTLGFDRSDKLTLGNTTNISGNGTIQIGNASGVSQNFELAGGSMASANLFVGQQGGAATTLFTVSGGTVSVTGGLLIVGVNSSGTFVNSGGNVSSSANLNLGWNSFSGVYSQTSSGATTTVGTLGISNSSVLSIGGGAFSATTFNSLGSGSGNQVQVILSGGTTTLPAFPTSRGTNATATVTFDGGVLRPSAASATYLQNLTNAYLTNNGAIFDTNSNDITVAQALVDGTAAGTAGILTKRGNGTLTLSGSNTYTGLTSVAAGVLKVNGSIDGELSVGNLAILGGSGTINGFVSIAGGGILAPGQSPGTLTMTTGLSLADASVLDYELVATDTTAGGGINDLTEVTGNFILDGILNVAGTGDFSTVPIGTKWILFNYSGGTFTDNGLLLGSMPSLGSSDKSFEIDTATPGQVSLVVVPEPGAMALAVIGACLTGLMAWKRFRTCG